jgi:type II secretory pathway component PulJ
MQEWMAVAIPILAALSGVALGWLGRVKENKREVRADAAQDATMRFDIEYIKRGVDDLRAEMRTMRQEHNALTVRVARLEESGKSLMNRVNRLEGKT